MQIEELFINNYKEVISNAIKNRQDTALYAILPKNIVYRGKGEINEEYCKQNNFEIYNSVDFGGGIVGFQGDIVIVVLKHEGWNVGEQFISILNEYLHNQGINSTIEGNDIMIDGIYKTSSHSSTNVGNNCIYTGIQITFNADPEIIKHICLKDSVKIPRGLNYYQIDKQEILNLVFNFFEKQ